MKIKCIVDDLMLIWKMFGDKLVRKLLKKVWNEFIFVRSHFYPSKGNEESEVGRGSGRDGGLLNTRGCACFWNELLPRIFLTLRVRYSFEKKSQEKCCRLFPLGLGWKRKHLCNEAGKSLTILTFTSGTQYLKNKTQKKKNKPWHIYLLEKKEKKQILKLSSWRKKV